MLVICLNIYIYKQNTGTLNLIGGVRALLEGCKSGIGGVRALLEGCKSGFKTVKFHTMGSMTAYSEVM